MYYYSVYTIINIIELLEIINILKNFAQMTTLEKSSPYIPPEIKRPASVDFLGMMELVLDEHAREVAKLEKRMTGEDVDLVQTELLFPAEGWSSDVFSEVTIEDVSVALSALEQIQSSLEAIRSVGVSWIEHSVMGQDGKAAKGCRIYTSEEGLAIHVRAQSVDYNQHLNSPETKNMKGEVIAGRFEFNGEARINMKIPVTVFVGGKEVTQEVSVRLDQDGGWNEKGGSKRIDLDIGDGGIRRNPEEVAELHSHRDRSNVELTIGTVLGAASTMSFKPEDPGYTFNQRLFTHPRVKVLLQTPETSIPYNSRRHEPSRVPPGHHRPMIINPRTNWVHQTLTELGALSYGKFIPEIYSTKGANEKMVEYSDRRETGGPGLRLLENPAFSRQLLLVVVDILKSKEPTSENPLVIVDMGCGPGVTCQDIHELLTSTDGFGLPPESVSIHGVDISPHMVKEAEEQLEDKAQIHQASFHSADLLGLPKADLVISRMAAHYDDPRYVLPQLHGLLVEGGKAIITMNVDPNNEEPRDKVPSIYTEIRPGVRTREWLYRVSEMEKLLAENPDLNGTVTPVDMKTVSEVMFTKEERQTWDKEVSAIPDERGGKKFIPFRERYAKGKPYCVLVTLQKNRGEAN